MRVLFIYDKDQTWPHVDRCKKKVIEAVSAETNKIVTITLLASKTNFLIISNKNKIKTIKKHFDRKSFKLRRGLII